MKKTIPTYSIIFILIIAITPFINAQSPVYSMFTLNKLQYNPGYTGNNEALTIGLNYRNQWIGVEGSPVTMSIAAHAPIKKTRAGVGAAYLKDEIGVFDNSLASLYYSYRMPVRDDATLSFGLNFQWDYTALNLERANSVNYLDTAIPFDQLRKSTFNAGWGLYYTSPKVFLGASISNVLETAPSILATKNESRIEHDRTIYLMGGTIIRFSKNIAIKPSVLVRYAPNNPIGVDFNLNILLMESFWIGGIYRLDESYSAFVRFPLMRNLNIGLGADYSASDFNLANRGTMEVMVEYIFHKKEKNDKVDNIRFFW